MHTKPAIVQDKMVTLLHRGHVTGQTLPGMMDWAVTLYPL